MSTALERQDDIGWFFDNEGNRYRIRPATESEQQIRPGATVTIVERLSDVDEKNNVVGFKYRYVRLEVEPSMAARMIEVGPVCLGEMHFLPNGSAKVHITLGGKPITLN
jgi:hypothetical protein